MTIPTIRSITDLARDAKALVDEVRKTQEPIVITQRGREAAVLVPVELYRRLESTRVAHIVSPRLANPGDAALFTKTVTMEHVDYRVAEDPRDGV